MAKFYVSKYSVCTFLPIILMEHCVQFFLYCFVFLYCIHLRLHRIRLIVNIVDNANIVFESCLHCRQLRPYITLP